MIRGPARVEGGLSADDEITLAKRPQRKEKRFRRFDVKVLVDAFIAGVIDQADVH